MLLVALLSACGAPRTSEQSSAAVVIAKGGINHFPFAFDLPQGKLLVSYSTHPDEVVADPVDAARVVGGAAAVSAANFYLSGVAAISGGIYAASYITTAIDDHQERVHGWVSTDEGATWTARPGLLQLPEPPIGRQAQWGGLLFHRRLHRVGTTIAGTVYGGYARDRRADGGEWYRTAWVQSDDDGASWRVRSTVAEGPAGSEGDGEPTSALCADNRILVVMRTGPGSPLRATVSSDGGSTWRAPRELPGMVGWDPDLLPISDGIILSYGLPGVVHLARTSDCGETWTPLSTLPIETTSGYSGLAHLAGRVTVFIDAERETQVVGYPL